MKIPNWISDFIQMLWSLIKKIGGKAVSLTVSLIILIITQIGKVFMRTADLIISMVKSAIGLIRKVTRKKIIWATIMILVMTLTFLTVRSCRNQNENSKTIVTKTITTEKTKGENTEKKPEVEWADSHKGTATLLIIILLEISTVLFLFAMQRNRPNTGWVKVWERVRENRSILIFVPGCHILILYFRPDFYETLASNSVFWVDQVVVMLALVFSEEVYEKGKKTRKIHFLGKLALTILVIGNCVTLYEWNKSKSPDSKTEKSSSTPAVPTNPLPAVNPEGAKMVKKAFLDAGFNEDESNEMVEICKRESGCNQYESDGITPLRGRINPKDIGILQINEWWWQKELDLYGTSEMKSWNIKNPEGNIPAAVHLRKKYGVKICWSATARDALARGEIPFIAPTEDWGIKIPVNGRHLSTSGGEGTVILQINEKEEVLDGKSVVLKDVRVLRLKSVVGKPITMYLKFY